MGWFRRGTATAAASGRRTPSGPDPVAAAVAEAHSGGPLRRRVADLDAPVHELPLWIEVDECDGEVAVMETPLRYKVLPKALKVIVPASE